MVFLLLSVIYFFSVHSSQVENCARGNHSFARFGPTCEFLCHCGINQCDRVTGACPNNGECDGGWMGSGCQYANIAHNTTVYSNHLNNTAIIVDGRRKSCPYKSQLNSNPAYVTVSFGREVKITEVNIVFSNSDDIPPFTIRVFDGNQTFVCGSVGNTTVQTEYVINCNSTLYGQNLSINSESPAALNICEIQVSAGRNLAYGKSALQSSLYETYYASNAVDGLTYDATSSRTCTHTPESENPWWIVDLQASIMIQWFRIFNRPDDKDTTLNERLRNFRILLTQDNVTFNQYYQDQNNGLNDPPLVIEPGLKPDVLARFVKIDLNGTNRILTLCEVQVFGECVPGYYGGNCEKPCLNCKNLDCDKITGRCKSCVAGKLGDLCQIDCDDGFYGDNCSHSCGKCLGLCDKEDGRCSTGCQDGWKGAECLQECDLYFYGNCSTPCGHCAVRELCNKRNGSCGDGCASGWQAENCDIPCDVNYYGNCSERCGHCKDSSVCDKVNGFCASGLCSEGWKGDKCNIECTSTYYGPNCAQPCGHCLNNTCDRFTGNCSENGCESGWQGSRCDIKLTAKNFQQQPVTDTDVVVIGASVGAAVAIVAIIATVVICITVKRRRQNEILSSRVPNRNLPRKKEENIVYENSTFLDINDGIHSVQGLINEATEGKRIIGTKLEKEAVVPVKMDSEPYYNIGTALPSGTIALSKFWDYVQEKCLDKKYFSEEFEKLPSGPQTPTTVAQRPENKTKNRYKQLYAYDANRVFLKPLGDDKNDYINASFIDGFFQEKMYIASQGTTKDNVNDFWRMLWQNDVEKIVMLTGLFEGGRHKCELYWPEEEGDISTFGSVAVRLLDTDAFADYDIRTLQMSVGNKSKQLTQFHYTAWPDKGVPRAASSIVQFWNRVNRLPTKKPIVVHCSAGIGRTGTYVALDYIVNQAKAEGHLNVFTCVSNLRHQRVNMVQTEEQYIFLHETLIEALMLSGTATASDKFPKVYQELLEVDGDSGKLKLQFEYERLQNEAANHETVYATVKMADEEGIEVILNENEYIAAKKPENRIKNRYDNILPVDQYRVSLLTHVAGGNDYINAVVLPGHRKRQGFILTQTPLAGTITDFWRMIHDFEIKTIIMFDSTSSKTHDIGTYWPTEGNAHHGPFMVTLTNEDECRCYTERTLSLSLNGQDNDRTVRQFQFKNWAENSDVPGSIESLLQLLEAVEAWQKERDDKPVVVHCLNGAHKSGLYCVMSTVVERLKVERDVAIAQTIKRMRSIRQQIIPNFKQFRFCHECVLQYMKTFETYSNF
ncbi:hypothetical protein CHS0354_035469 [Potamilus streckersoni]|uniref:protein-tyrosine-phosphatase n=1 Tax=Potamilus streckersoni TaxID=2493646 RepID=A0AAE0VKQ2_9BIVA|nr:hypothetical protein CHS0354_035469 [Potamilus streckersoni]